MYATVVTIYQYNVRVYTFFSSLFFTVLKRYGQTIADVIILTFDTLIIEQQQTEILCTIDQCQISERELFVLDVFTSVRVHFKFIPNNI